jgi:hypothetical protein
MKVKRASVFLKKIESLKDQQWEDIYNTALENCEVVKQVGSAEGDDKEGGSDSSNDDELLDPMYDEIPAGN